VDQELKAYLDEQFGRQEERSERQGGQLARQEERLERLEDRVIENFRQVEGLQEESRHTRVLIEGMWSNVRLLAEGVMSAIEQQATLRNEMYRGFEDVKASIAPAYRDLDRRVNWLEARANRQDRDVFEVLRETLGMPQT
jgi:hypothetical protein